MTDTNWNGEITKEMFDFTQIETSYGAFINQVERYLINCLVGSAHLTGEGSLNDYWEDIIEETIKKGEIAIIEYPDTKEKFLAIPQSRSDQPDQETIKVKENLLKEPINLEFQLLDNEKTVLESSKVEKYVIFRFNKDGNSHLEGLVFELKD